MTTPVPSAPVSPLRQRMIEDMNMRRFSQDTQRDYIRDVGRFATFLGRSPDTATAEDLRRFQVEQRESGVPAPTMNSIVSALRFFFTHTLDRPDLARKLVRIHTWGSALTHHPHVHMIIPGGGIAPDGRWVSSRPAFLLPVRVLGALFRRLFLMRLIALHDAGKLSFFGTMAHLVERRAFLRHLSPVRKKRWVVYAKPPFGGPEAVLAYLARYTHRVAISNRRLIDFSETGVVFRYKDYRCDGADRQRVMTLAADEFIRRFLLHVLPQGFHRIRHYGLLAASCRKASLERIRALLAVATPPDADVTEDPANASAPCPCCGGRMIVIEVFERGHPPRAPPVGAPPNREYLP